MLGDTIPAKPDGSCNSGYFFNQSTGMCDSLTLGPPPQAQTGQTSSAWGWVAAGVVAASLGVALFLQHHSKPTTRRRRR